jgi:hypothetical protein
MSNTYDYGDLVRVTGTFTTAAGVATDPTAVLCKVRNPAGTVTTLTYGTDAALVKSGTGVYYTDVSASAAGIWHYRFYSTGTGQAANETYFQVGASEFD